MCSEKKNLLGPMNINTFLCGNAPRPSCLSVCLVSSLVSATRFCKVAFYLYLLVSPLFTARVNNWLTRYIFSFNSIRAQSTAPALGHCSMIDAWYIVCYCHSISYMHQWILQYNIFFVVSSDIFMRCTISTHHMDSFVMCVLYYNPKHSMHLKMIQFIDFFLVI